MTDTLFDFDEPTPDDQRGQPRIVTCSDCRTEFQSGVWGMRWNSPAAMQAMHRRATPEP